MTHLSFKLTVSINMYFFVLVKSLFFFKEYQYFFLISSVNDWRKYIIFILIEKKIDLGSHRCSRQYRNDQYVTLVCIAFNSDEHFDDFYAVYHNLISFLFFSESLQYIAVYYSWRYHSSKLFQRS